MAVLLLLLLLSVVLNCVDVVLVLFSGVLVVLSGVVVLLLVLSGVGSRVDEGYYRLVRAPPGPSPATAPILDHWESL